MEIASRLRAFGETVFTEMSALALERGAINLGQGFPNFDGPDFVKEAAAEAMRAGYNQYPPSAGIPELTEAIADRFVADTGIPLHPRDNVTVTSGCTEALASAFLGLVEPGDEVVIIEPFYDSYPVVVSLAGATPRFVTLRPPSFSLDEEALRAAFSAQTKAIVVNTPHNPTGRVFDRAELEAVAALCIEHDAIAITDEVYERIVFDGHHITLATLDGMWERTVTLSSLGKSFSLTGWKVGWAVAPPDLTAGVRAAHQFLTFTTPNPMQYGAAAALRAPDEYYTDLRAAYRSRRDLLVAGLDRLGFDVFVPQGTYFALADHTAFDLGDDIAFSRHLIDEAGVAAIPPSAFYHDPADGATLIRFAFCKDEATLAAALERMEQLRLA